MTRPTNPTMHVRTAALLLALAIAAHDAGAQSTADTGGLVKPTTVLERRVAEMPRSDSVDVRVLTASFAPGDRTVLHTHRYPVTVYVLEGTFTLEMAGRTPVVVRAGEAYVEPPRVRMTGYNRSTTERTRVVVFYTSEPGAPFLDLVSP